MEKMLPKALAFVSEMNYYIDRKGSYISLWMYESSGYHERITFAGFGMWSSIDEGFDKEHIIAKAESLADDISLYSGKIYKTNDWKVIRA